MCIHTHVYVPSNIFRHFKFENVAIRVCHEFMEHAFFFLENIQDVQTTKSRKMLPCVECLWQAGVNI